MSLPETSDAIPFTEEMNEHLRRDLDFETTVLPSNGQLLATETEELLTASVATMKADIAANPPWSGAPAPLDDFLLMFLRAEVFNPAKAADRYRKFWKVKVNLCGEEKAALPIKVADAAEALEREFCQMVPGSKDIEGRQVVYVDTGNADKSLDRKMRVRAVWYVILAALEDVETQRKGFCFVVSLKTSKISQVDHAFNKMVLDSIQGALPVRVGSMNMCYPPSFFRVLWTVISTFLHKRVQQRFRFIPGPDAQVQETLGCLVAAEHLPIPIGTKELNFASWLAERARNEA